MVRAGLSSIVADGVTLVQCHIGVYATMGVLPVFSTVSSNVTQLRTSPPCAYNLSVLSEIILLCHVRKLAPELCRLSNIDDREKASLDWSRYFLFRCSPRAHSWIAWPLASWPPAFLEETNRRQNRSPHTHHDPLLTTSSGRSTRQLEDRIGARRRLCSVHKDSIIIVKIMMHVVRPSQSHTVSSISP
jgi:hypothetical protein